jgi:hypothetical protein
LRFRFENRRLEKIIVHPPFPVQRIHISDYHISCLKSDLVDSCAGAPKLYPQPTGAAEAKALIGNRKQLVVIHPGSGSAKKNWPTDSFETLASFLTDRSFSVVWVLGPADFGIVPGNAPGTMLRNASLSALVHVCSSSSLYVGNDSGISHLAAATMLLLLQQEELRVFRVIRWVSRYVVIHAWQPYLCHKCSMPV